MFQSFDVEHDVDLWRLQSVNWILDFATKYF